MEGKIKREREIEGRGVRERNRESERRKMAHSKVGGEKKG